jgi:hypothetical protein
MDSLGAACVRAYDTYVTPLATSALDAAVVRVS